MEGNYIRFNPKRNRVLISKQCIAELGHPKKVRLLINPDKKMLVLQPSGNKEQIYFKVPKDLLSAGGKPFEICSQLLLTQIWSIMHWECMETYAVSGVLSADMTIKQSITQIGLSCVNISTKV